MGTAVLVGSVAGMHHQGQQEIITRAALAAFERQVARLAAEPERAAERATVDRRASPAPSAGRATRTGRTGGTGSRDDH